MTKIELLTAVDKAGYPRVLDEHGQKIYGRRHWREAIRTKTARELNKLLYRMRRMGLLDTGATQSPASPVALQVRGDDPDSREIHTPPPSDREFAILCEGLDVARRHGLRVERCGPIAWFDEWSDNAVAGLNGYILFDTREIHLRLGRTDGGLLRTVVHELCHLHDLNVLGYDAYCAMPEAQREERARMLEFAVMRAEGFEGVARLD